jgi:hypothetical protein
MRNYCQDHTEAIAKVEAIEREAKDHRKEFWVGVVMVVILFGLPILAGSITG